MELKEKLTGLRKDKGLSQSQLAQALRVSRQTVSRWESGKSIPTVDNLKYLSELYGVPLDTFFRDTDEPERGDETTEAVALPSVEEHRSCRRWLAWAAVLLCALLTVAAFCHFAAVKDEEKAVSINDIPVQEVKPDDQMQFDFTW